MSEEQSGWLAAMWIQMAAKVRLDLLLVERGLAPTRAKAQGLIMAGQVYVAGQKRTKAGEPIVPDAPIEVRGGLDYVGRGGLKLAHALDIFGVEVTDLIALDVGACTGGFTDVLLQRGARRVYAIDVGYGQLAYELRVDPRVVVLERTNIRHLETLPDGALADCGVVDVSFISLRLVLPPIGRLLRPGAPVVALVKPQFEAEREEIGKGGVVKDPAVHDRVCQVAARWVESRGWAVLGITRSPITGPEGNVEFLLAATRS